MTERLVAKVGGSLLDWPGLRPQLQAWLRRQAAPQILLVPGGGPTADVIRDLDRIFQLGEETAHWLALRSLALNAHFLAELISIPVVTDWQDEALAILDAYAFCRADEGRAGYLPHRWQVTSDSVAARAAQVFGATRLVLLKSVDMPDLNLAEAAAKGFVDGYFSRAAAGLQVEAVNLRTWSSLID